MVDAVKGVRKFEQSELETPPKVGMRLSTELINAIGKTATEFVMILNVDKVLSDEDLSLAKDITEAVTGESGHIGE